MINKSLLAYLILLLLGGPPAALASHARLAGRNARAGLEAGAAGFE